MSRVQIFLGKTDSRDRIFPKIAVSLSRVQTFLGKTDSRDTSLNAAIHKNFQSREQPFQSSQGGQYNPFKMQKVLIGVEDLLQQLI